MDASRKDGSRVAIKRLSNGGQEVEVSQFLTSLRHPHNHCAPVLDVFPDPLNPGNQTLLVMPYLRPFNDPDFVHIGEVLDFISQMLEVSAKLTPRTHRDLCFSGARVHA